MFDPSALGLDVFGIYGDEAAVLCPFHDDHRATNAQFNVRKGLFHCFACGKNSNARQIAKLLGGSLETLSDTAFIRRTKDEKEWRHLLYAPFAFGHPYLKRRGIREDEVESFRILEISDGFIGTPIYGLHGDQPVGLNLRRVPDNCKRRRSGPVLPASSLGWLSHTTSRYIFLGTRPPLSLLAPDTPDSFFRDKRPRLVEGIFAAFKARRFANNFYPCLGAGANNRLLALLNGREPQIYFDDDFAGYLGAAKLLRSSPDGRALVPGLDFDLIDTREDFERALAIRHNTNSISELATLSDDREAFLASLAPRSPAR